MDPLSLTANIIAVLKAASSASDTLSQLFGLRNDVPGEILQSMNEISDIQAVITILDATFKGANEYSTVELGISNQLQPLLYQAKKTLLEINGVLEEGNVNRITWVRKKSRFRRLSTTLRDIRLQINMTLTTLTASEIPHTRIELKAVAVENTRTLDSFHCFEESTGKQLDVLTQVFSTVQSSLDAKNIVTRWAEAESSNKKSPTAAPVQVQTSLLDMTSCDKACACNCHKTRRLMVPCWLQAIMGFLLIGYSGLKLSGNSCNEKICRQQQKSILTLNYYFPRWFVYQRLINFRNYWSPIEGNIMSIRTPRIIERSTTTVFDMACQGNLEGLKRLFIQGLASPFDVNGSGKCDSVLFYSLVYRGLNLDMCELLLNEGADPNLENQMGFSPVDHLWNALAANPRDRRIKAIWDLFSRYVDVEESLQRRNFSNLHKIVIGLSFIDLESLLHISTAIIDDRDSTGRTALHWAASMSSIPHLQTLIKFGATLHLRDAWGATPLNRACVAGTAQAVETLLQAALRPPPFDWSSKSSNLLSGLLGYSTKAPNVTSIHDSYIKFFIEQKLHAGTTALFDACLTTKSSSEKVRLLLNYSADMDIPVSETPKTNPASTPLLYCVQSNNHDVLKLLLDKGARTDVKDLQEMSILHLAAYDGDLETLTILNSRRVKGTIKFYGQNDIDTFGNSPLLAFDVGRPLDHPDEDEFIRQRCRKVFLQLLKPMSW